MKHLKQKVLLSILAGLYITTGIINTTYAQSNWESNTPEYSKATQEKIEEYRKTDVYKQCMQREKDDQHCILGWDSGVTVVWSSKQQEQKKVTCKPIKLNTYFPFLWDKIGCNGTEPINQTTAFAYMIKGLMKLVITIIMVVSFLMIVAAGVLMASAWPDTSKYSNGLGIIKNVATALALLGASGVILKLINPNFFV